MLMYFQNIGRGIITVLKSMAVAWRHLFTKSVTLQYPTERWIMPERSRARLFNKIEDCIGCGQCARVCTTNCIWIQTEKRGKDEPEVLTSGGVAIKLRTYVYDIDMAHCCYCGICTFSCPTHSLVMTPAYEYSVYDKSEFRYHFAKDKPMADKTSKANSIASV
jgi:NADH-quinone oxidoreductase subunit I